ncbi:mitochondrial import inner membrane translocase subunit tim29 [Plakobranchus ocellatus]|uniref:Mitochondrial import inner membrane translocase subunit tim29 n=1 Tax=Plakobranchus ocellatus TaxID=259542 RepID=A0AAV3YDD9_9GAST|nr:mitochondrial import inner membrane translocase subunit tim29 [Plakobranchus ocellatus]
MAGPTAKVATKAKVGLLKRFGEYLLMVANDYKVVAQETFQDVTSGSIKAASYLSGLVALGVLHRANPTKRDLETVLMESAHDLSLVGESIRSEKADEFVDKLCSAQRDGRLHYTSLGILSLVWISEQRDGLDLYTAKCKHTNLPWYQWHEKVVDVGILGKFMVLDKNMKDYDVNQNEWDGKENSS